MTWLVPLLLSIGLPIALTYLAVDVNDHVIRAQSNEGSD